ncbi:hypothetical protein [Candidatus Chlamydia corallus]|uniref:hypothetical protein n=1 Tax=Candidatus Chlamydia corallus TaxID=2038470 RepID=UPI000C2FE4BE|nr:hypothetical protein [Candidatus Chlamydia corallus]
MKTKKRYGDPLFFKRNENNPLALPPGTIIIKLLTVLGLRIPQQRSYFGNPVKDPYYGDLEHEKQGCVFYWENANQSILQDHGLFK